MMLSSREKLSSRRFPGQRVTTRISIGVCFLLALCSELRLPGLGHLLKDKAPGRQAPLPLAGQEMTSLILKQQTSL